LRAFVVLAAHQQFTRAALELGVVQPALSKRIRQLEDDLGVRLFDRTRRQVRLTREGSSLVGPARRTLDAAARVEASARQLRDGFVDQLSIGVTPSAPARLLPEIVRRFRAGHPRTACVVTQAASEELLDAVEAGDLDVAIVRVETGRRRAAIHCAALVAEPFVVAVPRGHRLARRTTIALGDLAGEPFVMVARAAAPSVYDQILAACRTAGFSPQVRQQVRDVHAVLTAVAVGSGVAIVPDSVRHMGLTAVACRRLSPRLTTALGIARRADRPGPAVAAFTAAARASVREEAG
jgi:DNA-binding transcriptional LysR family regulator